MAAPVQSGVKTQYVEHLVFDETLQPIANAGGGLPRGAFEENLFGHLSGANVNGTPTNNLPFYTAATVTPITLDFHTQQMRGNPNGY